MAEGAKKPTFKQILSDLDGAITDMLCYFEQVDTSDLPTMLKAFALLKDNKEKLSSLEEIVSKQYQKLSYEILPNAFETLGFDSVKVGSRNFSVSTRVNANIPEDKRDVGHKWIIEVAKVPELIKPTVNAKQLSSFVKTYFETHGQWPPEEAINVHMQNYIQVRKV